MNRQDVYSHIDAERDYQQLMGKSDTHSLEDWAAILQDYTDQLVDLVEDGFPAEAEETILKIAAIAEGVWTATPEMVHIGHRGAKLSHLGAFRNLWRRINGPEDGPAGWLTNPYVRVIKFERIESEAT